MILSMTGYGDSTLIDGETAYAVEVRCQNNRYFKAGIKLPEYMQYLEPEVDKLIRERLHRGSISYVLRVRAGAEEAAYDLNPAAIRGYVSQLSQAIGDTPGLGVQVDLAGLLQLPGVCQPRVPDERTRHRWLELLRDLTGRALDQVLEMRAREGRALADDLLAQCEQIERRVAAVAERAPAVVEQYRERLTGRIKAMLQQDDVRLDPDALVREVAIFTERSDINEELSRLGSHLTQFRGAVESGKGVGKKLEFIGQEMLREANTIASKANDAEIAIHTVEIKSAVDRIKEQVQNVE